MSRNRLAAAVMDEYRQESTRQQHALSGFPGVHLAVDLYCTSGFALSDMESPANALAGANLPAIRLNCIQNVSKSIFIVNMTPLWNHFLILGNSTP